MVGLKAFFLKFYAQSLTFLATMAALVFAYDRVKARERKRTQLRIERQIEQERLRKLRKARYVENHIRGTGRTELDGMFNAWIIQR